MYLLSWEAQVGITETAWTRLSCSVAFVWVSNEPHDYYYSPVSNILKKSGFSKQRGQLIYTWFLCRTQESFFFFFFFFFFLHLIVFFAHLVVFLHISLSFAHLIVFCTSYCFALFYFIAHFTLISPFLTICMPLCYVTYTICILIVLHCPLSGPDSIAFHF